MKDLKSKFMEVYSILKSEILHDSASICTDESLQWLEQMMDYNVPTGMLNRGLLVVDCYITLREGQEASDDDIFLACVLGWCIEWAQACALMIDDIVDNSQTRRGKPCWFRLNKVGMKAVNDAIVLLSHIPRILKLHFREKPYYVDLLDLFNEVGFQSVCGEMIDLITTNEGVQDLSKYTLPDYFRIAAYKGAYYSIYLPVACALLLAGENLDKHAGIKSILVEIAAYYQVQDDFLDCFGDPKVTGKVGTDIEDCKCSWLVVKAMERASDEQKKLLQENYGKTDPVCVAKVKKLYEDLNLQSVYIEYERKSYEKLVESFETHPSKAVQAVWKRYSGSMRKVLGK